MSELTKYIVLTDEGNRSEINDALMGAGFDGLEDRGRYGLYAIIINYDKRGSVGDATQLRNCDNDNVSILIPSQILNGGAQKLDGAKVVEPRYLGYFGELKRPWVAEFIGNEKGTLLYWGGARESEIANAFGDYEGRSFHEITKSDFKYIRDNAAKAKELGMVLRKPKWGVECEVLTSEGDVISLFYAAESFCAGHRYCRKAEEETVEIEGTKYTKDQIGSIAWCAIKKL